MKKSHQKNVTIGIGKRPKDMNAMAANNGVESMT